MDMQVLKSKVNVCSLYQNPESCPAVLFNVPKKGNNYAGF